MTKEKIFFKIFSYFLFEVPNLQLVVTVLGWQGRLVLVYTGLDSDLISDTRGHLTRPESPRSYPVTTDSPL